MKWPPETWRRATLRKTPDRDRTPVCMLTAVTSDATGSRRQRDRLALFDRGWSALKGLLPGYSGPTIYVCPLCLRAFYREQVGDPGLGIPYLDREHAPQRFRDRARPARCLTCRVCNSGAGRFESLAGIHATEMAKLRAGQRARFHGHVDGQRGLVELQRVSHQHLHVHTAFASVVGIDLEMAPAEHAAWVKSAICLGFATLGYSFVLCAELDQIREAAAGRAEMTDQIAWFLVENDLEDQLFIAEQPFPAAVVVLSRRAIVLPRHGSPTEFAQAVRSLGAGFQRFGGTECYSLAPSPSPSDRMPMHWDMCRGSHPRCVCPMGLVEDRPA